MKIVSCVREGGRGELLSIVYDGLPCGGCQRFEFAYLQLMNLANTRLYDSTQFF